MAQKNITSDDVAKLAKVSQSAVSRTFTPGASVSEKTRSKVLAAAKKLSYRPNAIARTLVTQQSRVIGVVVAHLDNPLYLDVLESLSKRLQREGLHVLLFMADAEDADQILQEILQYQVQGILMASVTLSSGLAEECADLGIPVVLFNRIVPGTHASTVSSDNFGGGQRIGRFLLRGGHEKIAYIAGQEESSTNRDREGGFLSALQDAKFDCWQREVGNYDFEEAADATRRLMSGSEVPDAIFVASDAMAISVIDTLRNEYDMQLPDDISVVGYDNIPQAAWAAYSLTTVEQQFTAMIRIAVQTLLRQIQADQVTSESFVLPGDLVIRGSARIPPNLVIENTHVISGMDD
jgi:DNA-binding LacI/PurR family transcriptional regulator